MRTRIDRGKGFEQVEFAIRSYIQMLSDFRIIHRFFLECLIRIMRWRFRNKQRKEKGNEREKDEDKDKKDTEDQEDEEKKREKRMIYKSRS